MSLFGSSRSAPVMGLEGWCWWSCYSDPVLAPLGSGWVDAVTRGATMD